MSAFIMVQIPRPAPRPEPEQIHPYLLAITVCVSAMLGVHQHEIDGLLEVVQATTDPLPQEMLDLIQLPNLTEEQKRSLFRRMVAYVFRTHVSYLLNELLRLQREIEVWQFWRNPERYSAESLIFMIVTLAVLATHIYIDATYIIDIFQPFIVHHIQADQHLTPLLQMLRRPQEQRNIRLIWRERIMEALIQLSRNLLENQSSG